MCISCFSSTLLCQSIARIPGNHNYEKRIEFGSAVKYYYGKRFATIFQVCLNITLQSYNIASIIICAQSIDQACISLFGSAYALQIVPTPLFTSFNEFDSLYSSSRLCISLGYLIILVLFLPQGFQNLDDNVKTIQVASFIFLVVLLSEFVGYFIWKGNNNGYKAVPAVGGKYSQIVSVFIFSWAYVIFVPSWLNEKKHSVSVNKVIWGSGITSFIGYLCIGLLCAVAIPEIRWDNVLVGLSDASNPIITRITSHLFSLGVIAPGIPVCSVTTRYNLFVSKLCSKKWSYFWYSYS
jgi:hypothetical protein